MSHTLSQGIRVALSKVVGRALLVERSLDQSRKGLADDEINPERLSEIGLAAAGGLKHNVPWRNCQLVNYQRPSTRPREQE